MLKHTNELVVKNSGNKNRVEVQIIVLKIGRIDTKNEAFYAEFVINSSWTIDTNNKLV